MSCCGEPVNKNKEDTNRVVPFNIQSINQQPSPHPGAQFQEKAAFQHPGILSPPPTHQYNGNTYGQNNVAQPQVLTAWAQPGQPTPSPPPVNQFNSFVPPTSPLLPPSTPTNNASNTYNGSANGYAPLTHPSPVQSFPYRADTTSPAASIAVPPMTATSSQPDEGKMSVSIDFGKCLYKISHFTHKFSIV